MSDDPFGLNKGTQPTPQPEEKQVEKKPAAKKAPEKTVDPKRTGIANRGIPVITDNYPEPPLPTWANRENAYDIAEDINFDFEDLSEINKRLNQSRIKFYRIGSQLKDAQRHLSDAKSAYNRRMRRELLNTSGGTEKTRIASAELACEDWENDVAVATQLVSEITNEQRIASKDLDVLESLANNARAQLKIM